MNRVLERLMIDLSIRSNNEHAGSGLGGNPSEFFFMLTHNVRIDHHYIKTNDSIQFTEKNNVIVISCPENVKLSALRKELSKFYDRHLDKQDVNFDQLCDQDFLGRINDPSLNIIFLMKCLNSTRQFLSAVNDKQITFQAIGSYFSNEYSKVKEDAKKYFSWTTPPYPSKDGPYSIPENGIFTEKEMFEYDFFHDPHESERSMFEDVMFSHDLFKSRVDSIEARKKVALDSLYSEEDNKLIDSMSAFPDYISSFCIRKVIGLDLMIKYSLDEYPKLAVLLSRVNAILEENNHG